MFYRAVVQFHGADYAMGDEGVVYYLRQWREQYPALKWTILSWGDLDGVPVYVPGEGS